MGTRQPRLFLRRLWRAAGLIDWDEVSRTCQLTLDVRQRRVVDDVARLMLSCNLMCEIEAPPGGGNGRRLSIAGAAQQLCFLD